MYTNHDPPGRDEDDRIIYEDEAAMEAHLQHLRNCGISVQRSALEMTPKTAKVTRPQQAQLRGAKSKKSDNTAVHSNNNINNVLVGNRFALLSTLECNKLDIRTSRNKDSNSREKNSESKNIIDTNKNMVDDGNNTGSIQTSQFNGAVKPPRFCPPIIIYNIDIKTFVMQIK